MMGFSIQDALSVLGYFAFCLLIIHLMTKPW